MTTTLYYPDYYAEEREAARRARARVRRRSWSLATAGVLFLALVGRLARRSPPPGPRPADQARRAQ